MKERTLKLNEVTVDNDLNPRVGALDQVAVLEYREALEDLPPMHVFEVPGEGYLLVAGFHRFAAYELAGAAEAIFVVHEGDRDAAAEFADLDNLQHGIQLTRAEKRGVISRQLKRHPDWSDSRLARACHTTDKTVRSVREDLEQRSEIPRLDKLVGADGITRPREIERPTPEPVAPGPALPGIDDGDDQDQEWLTPAAQADPPPPAPTSPPKPAQTSPAQRPAPPAAKAPPKAPPPPPPAPKPKPVPAAPKPTWQIIITVKPGEALGGRHTLISVLEGSEARGSWATTYDEVSKILQEIEAKHLTNGKDVYGHGLRV